MLFQQILDVAKYAALRVGGRIGDELKSSQHAQFSRKAPTDLVTEVDIWAENEIRSEIFKHFASHTVIGEETAGEFKGERKLELAQLAQNGVCWIIDPIDGTNNFTNRLPVVTVSIGVLVDGQRAVGVVYDPGRRELFSAVKGSGAWCNERQIRSSSKSEMIDAIVSADFPNQQGDGRRYEKVIRPLVEQSRSFRRFGCASLEQCWVACGRLDGYFGFNLKPWDVAAASLIVDEACGRCGNLQIVDEQLSVCQDGFSCFVDSYLFAGAELYSTVTRLLGSS